MTDAEIDAQLLCDWVIIFFFLKKKKEPTLLYTHFLVVVENC